LRATKTTRFAFAGRRTNTRCATPEHRQLKVFSRAIMRTEVELPMTRGRFGQLGERLSMIRLQRPGPHTAEALQAHRRATSTPGRRHRWCGSR
jgi:hypothetical protein